MLAATPMNPVRNPIQGLKALRNQTYDVPQLGCTRLRYAYATAMPSMGSAASTKVAGIWAPTTATRTLSPTPTDRVGPTFEMPIAKLSRLESLRGKRSGSEVGVRAMPVLLRD